MDSKTIILSSEGGKERGILTLAFDGELLQCRLRLYNLEPLNIFCKLGVYHKEQVYSANLLFKNGAYTSSLVGDFDMQKDFYCAIVDTSNGNNVLLSGGTYAGFFFSDNSVFEHSIETDEPKIEVDALTEQQQKIKISNEQESDKFDCAKCEKCKYKEFFYSNSASAQSEIIQKEDIKQLSLIDSIMPQFDYVFTHYPLDEELASLVPNSKFAKVSEGRDNYSIGTISANGNIKFLCYAVRANYRDPVPSELGEHCQWLPLDQEDPLSDGYYLVYQDANNLRIVE